MSDQNPGTESLTGLLRRLPADRVREFLDRLSDEEAALVRTELEESSESSAPDPLDHQIEPAGDHRGFLLTGGRGAGKTQALSYNAVRHMQGPACDSRVAGGHRVTAISPTSADAVSALHNGPSGITAHWPGTRLRQGAGGSHLETPSGVLIRLAGAFTSEDAERQRASGNNCLALCDELAAWRRNDVWDHMTFGLRLGPAPKWYAATTPKPRELFRRLLSDSRVVHTHATMNDNPYLPESVKEDLSRRYEGTRLGRQELFGELLEDIEGALWDHELIEACRGGHITEARRVAVGVDPSGSESGDEMGIVVVGIDPLDHAWVLEDASTAGRASQRFEAACLAADRHSAGTIVYEANYGGDQVGFGIEAAWSRLADIGRVPRMPPRIRRTPARGSKSDRMQPVVAAYERGEISHVGGLGELEEQQCGWEPGCGWSPDRVDALVYAVREVTGSGGPVTWAAPPPVDIAGDSVSGRRPVIN
ncbi:MAG: terminase large subunit domain-containing protein [Nocardioidaceae bacterium]